MGKLLFKNSFLGNDEIAKGRDQGDFKFIPKLFEISCFFSVAMYSIIKPFMISYSNKRVFYKVSLLVVLYDTKKFSCFSHA